VPHPDTLEALRSLPHFRMIDPRTLARIAQGCRWRTLAAGETLFLEGQPCRAFYAIHSGGVRLYRLAPDGREHVVHNLRTGASFAEAALLSLGRFPVHAVATEQPTEILEIGGDPLLRLFREEERLGPAMVGSLCMHLVSLVERVEELSLAQAGERLARWLLRQPASGSPERLEVELSMSKRDIASHLAMTPETLSRLLRKWQEQGWIESRRSSVVIRTAEALSALAEGEPT
jgi:CRP-like cAMP-binding protein